MRNAFVLVTLCIGLATGSDSWIRRKSNQSSDTTHRYEDNSTIAVASSTVKARRLKQLPSNRMNIDEHALYEHASAKRNNQSERAFIYINQKYKKPTLHQYFKLAHSGGSEFSKRFSASIPVPQKVKLHHVEHDPCKFQPTQTRSYFEEYDFPGRMPEIASYFVAPKVSKCNKVDEQPKKVHNYKNDVHVENAAPISNYNGFQKQYNNRNNSQKVTQHRDYIELLKPPILRSSNIEVKPKFDVIQTSRHPSLNYNDLVKHYHNDIQFSPKVNGLVDERKNEIQSKYGFGPYAYTAYQNQGRLQRVEELDVEKELTKDDDITRSLDKVQDEELFDQYLKETLEDQVVSKEISGSSSDCRYHDCNISSAKTASSVSASIPTILGHQQEQKQNCKCGSQSKSKQKQLSLIPKERPEREEIKCNKTINHKPGDVKYYEDALAEDSSIKKNNIDLKLINKLNDTLYS